jgi:hypothetical protein
MGKIPVFQPKTEVKLLYSPENLFVIFRVCERYVRCVNTQTNGKVYEDSCVEFFFAPDAKFPERYFNLEINCGGTALMQFHTVARKDFQMVSPENIGKIEIAHSMPKITEPEISESVTWTIACRIPFEMLSVYCEITKPKPGVQWKANFYKTASNNSNPHYLTWKKIENEKPDFHLPNFFATLYFQ